MSYADPLGAARNLTGNFSLRGWFLAAESLREPDKFPHTEHPIQKGQPFGRGQAIRQSAS
jgi:hypothetical protein